jgi:hypothetical protein
MVIAHSKELPSVTYATGSGRISGHGIHRAVRAQGMKESARGMWGRQLGIATHCRSDGNRYIVTGASGCPEPMVDGHCPSRARKPHAICPFPVSLLASTLSLEALCSTETPVMSCQTTPQRAIFFVPDFTGFMDFVHRPEFQMTRKHDVSETGPVSVFR